MSRRTGSSGLLLLALGLLGLRWAFVGTSREGLRGNKVAMEAERKFIVGRSGQALGGAAWACEDM